MAIPKLLNKIRNSASKEYVDASGLPFVDIESSDGLTYTGASTSIKEYKAGSLLILTPSIANVASTAIKNITVNINNLGPMQMAQYTVKKRGVKNALGMWSEKMAVEASFIYPNEPFVAQIQGDSSQWYILPIARGLYMGEFANDTFGANLSVDSSTNTNGILRNIHISTATPTSDDGKQGDIWFQYEE